MVPAASEVPGKPALRFTGVPTAAAHEGALPTAGPRQCRYRIAGELVRRAATNQFTPADAKYGTLWGKVAALRADIRKQKVNADDVRRYNPVVGAVTSFRITLENSFSSSF